MNMLFSDGFERPQLKLSRKLLLLNWPFLLLITAIANTATPAIAAFWATHASAAAIFAPLAVIVAHWLPSPYAGTDPKTDQETAKP